MHYVDKRRPFGTQSIAVSLEPYDVQRESEKTVGNGPTNNALFVPEKRWVAGGQEVEETLLVHSSV